MVDFRMEKFGVDEPIVIDKNWYTFADFHVSAPKKGLFGSLLHLRTTFGHRIFLLISSEGLSEKPVDSPINDSNFSKRLQLEKFDEEKIKQYIQTKLSEASRSKSVAEAFAYLDDIFEVDD